MADFIEDVPVGSKGSRWRGVTEERWEGIKWGPIFIKQGCSGEGDWNAMTLLIRDKLLQTITPKVSCGVLQYS